MRKFQKFLADEEGLESVEYAMILAFVSLGLLASIVFLSGAVENRFQIAGNNVATGS